MKAALRIAVLAPVALLACAKLNGVETDFCMKRPDVCKPLRIVSVSSSAALVAPGQRGIAVKVVLENAAPASPVDVTDVHPVFRIPGGGDLSAHFTDPGKKTLSLSPKEQRALIFTVDARPSLPPGELRISAWASGTVEGRPIGDQEESQFAAATAVAPPVVLDLQRPPDGNGCMRLDFRLRDPWSLPADVSLEYSTDNGVSFEPARLGRGGEGRYGLATTPDGASHSFMWSSAGVNTGTGPADVLLRMRARGVGPFGAPADVNFKVTPSSGLAALVPFDGPGGPVDGAIADFDGDGHDDLALADAAKNLIWILPGDPASATGFGPDREISLGQVVALAAGDINGDGKIDLVAGLADGSVVPVLNDPTDPTGFRQGTAEATADGLKALALADENRDGNLDVVVLTASNSSLYVLHGTGNGTFSTPPGQTNLPAVPRDFVLADFDLDGYLDVAVTYETASVVDVLHGSAAGGFTPSNSTTLVGSGTDLAVGDVDRDGMLELVVAIPDASKLAIVNSPGQIGATATYVPTIAGVDLVRVGFVDRDAFPDVVVAYRTGAGALAVMSGNASGSLDPPVFYDTNGPGFAAIHDWNGDGAADIVAASGNGVRVFRNQAVPDCGTELAGREEGDPTPIARMIVADLDGDRIPDVISTDGGAFKVVADLSTQGRTELQTAGAPLTLLAADLNDDGVSDLVVVSQDFADVFRGVRGGAPTLVGHTSLQDVGTPLAAVLGYFNGDHLLDLEIADSAGSLVLYAGDPTQGFTFWTSVPMPAVPVALAAGDLKPGGDTDVVVVTSDNQISVMRSGQFAQASTAIASSPVALAVGDRNGDGMPDVSVAEAGGHIELFQYSKTQGTLNLIDSADTIPGITDMLAFDIDRDGAEEWIAASDSGTVEIVHGLSSGKGSESLEAPFYPKALAAADLDQDGRPELVVGNGLGWSTYAAGDLGGLVSATRLTTAAPHPFALLAESLNGSSPDLVTTDDSGLSIFEAVGNGQFNARSPVSTPPGPIATAHLLASSTTPLLLVARTSDVKLAIFEDAPGGWAETAASGIPLSANPNWAPVALAVGDVDLDRKEDVIALSGTTPEVVWLKGDGAGGLVAQPPIQLPGVGGAIGFGDLNGDGVGDVVVARGNGDLLVLHGNGVGFDPATVFSGAAALCTVTSLRVADLDGDGRSDIALGCNQGVTTVRQSPNGPLVLGPTVRLSEAVNAIDVGDVTGDGLTDIVATAGGHLLILAATGPGYLSYSVDRLGTGVALGAVVVRDLSHDGKLDVAVVDTGPGSVNVSLAQ